MVSNSQTANIDAKQSISIMRCLVLFQRLHELKVIRSENEVVSHEASMPSYSGNVGMPVGNLRASAGRYY